MCGRYALHASPAVIALQFGLDSPPELQPHYNIAPATEALVVKDGRVSPARWGMRGRLVNLRAETVLAKFSGSGRCLVPASGFYEWQTRGTRKQPYYFVSTHDPLLGLAALWENNAFTLITTEPGPAMRGIHDRMPLIIGKEAYAAWLDGDESLLEKPVSVELVARPVSMAVNRAANDSPALIEPVELDRGLFD